MNSIEIILIGFGAGLAMMIILQLYKQLKKVLDNTDERYRH